MAMTNSFPPDVPGNAEEMREEAGATVRTLRNKAADMAGRASDTVKEGYERARDAWDEAEPLETIREGGEAVVRGAERHPLAMLGLGALSLGLIAWATMRPQPSWQSSLARHQPDYGRWRGWLNDYGSEAAAAGQRALNAGSKWLGAHRDVADDYADRAGDYAARARDYADVGGRMLAKRAEREPIAALLGVGLAIYVVGALLSSSSAAAGEAAPARSASRAPARKRTKRS
ncbi:hypothetical protein [Bosea sp. BH3]|uniref:hypothetical protein n=1 Tax=Bosea sp. BH3 TaxID=2871701 RepID=UPI0021CB6209|nr:hypothetical protein [Bosea sp. BH3]MCU4178045.1 hypothetical protein [Bosea sp. BH3]